MSPPFPGVDASVELAAERWSGPKNTWVLTEDINTTRIAYGYRFDGSRWHRQVLPASADANSDVGYVTGSPSNNIWALAFAGARAASMRYNGSKWQVFKFPARLGPAAALLGPEQILALSSNDVWATVRPGRFTGVATLVLLHWNGRNWSKIIGKLPECLPDWADRL